MNSPTRICVHLNGKLKVVGEVDMLTAPLLRVAPVPLSGEIDLSGVTFMDASGLRALLALRRQRYIKLVGVSQPVMRLIELAGVEGEFDHVIRSTV